MEDLTIIIPTLNEVSNISSLLSKLTFLYPFVKIIVVDDGSVDGTVDSVLSFDSRNVTLVNRANSNVLGLTASILSGISKVKTKYFVVMDGDFQHPPEVVKSLYDNLKLGYKLVVGVRSRRTIIWERLSRKFVSDLGTYLGSLVLFFRGKLSLDPLSGFFGCDTSLFKILIKNRFVLRGYKILFDILKQLPSSFKISEVSFDFSFRNGGCSKISFKHFYYYGVSLIK